VITTKYETNRLILREMLTSRGAEVIEAEDGPQGLALLERARLSGQPFNLLLLDCRMPGMDGFQVAERINAAGYKGLSLLMLTSDDLKVDLARLGHLGLDAYLVKPVHRVGLLEAIAAAMARHQSASPANGEPPAATPSRVAAAPLKRPLRILLADDARDNRVLVRAYLKSRARRLTKRKTG
jgi:CheY-like chemotaxis protein